MSNLGGRRHATCLRALRIFFSVIPNKRGFRARAAILIKLTICHYRYIFIKMFECIKSLHGKLSLKLKQAFWRGHVDLLKDAGLLL